MALMRLCVFSQQFSRLLRQSFNKNNLQSAHMPRRQAQALTLSVSIFLLYKNKFQTMATVAFSINATLFSFTYANDEN